MPYSKKWLRWESNTKRSWRSCTRNAARSVTKSHHCNLESLSSKLKTDESTQVWDFLVEQKRNLLVLTLRRAKAALYSVCVVVKHRVFVLLHKKQKSSKPKPDFFIVKCPVKKRKTCWKKQWMPHIRWEWPNQLHIVNGETAILTSLTFLWWHKVHYGRNTDFPVACFSQRKVFICDNQDGDVQHAAQKGFRNNIYDGHSDWWHALNIFADTHHPIRICHRSGNAVCGVLMISSFCHVLSAAGSERHRTQQPDSAKGQRDPEQRGQVGIWRFTLLCGCLCECHGEREGGGGVGRGGRQGGKVWLQSLRCLCLSGCWSISSRSAVWRETAGTCGANCK